MEATEEIDRISLYTERKLVFHAYVGPFLLLYLGVFYMWIFVYGFHLYFEIGCIVLAAVGICQILTCLSCHWSVNARCFLTCSKEASPFHAKLVKVVPTPNNGSTDLVRLNHEKGEDQKPLLWFEFQKIKYLYDPEEKKEFNAISFPVDYSMQFYQNCKGYQEESDIRIVNQKYGPNRIDMTVPDFWELFKERAVAPFFVFQVFCVGLWCLDEYWYYSIFTLFMLVVFEGTLVHQQQRNMREIRNMSSKPFPIQVYRYRKWRFISSDELLPGDICSIVRSKVDMMVPCDILLLRGSLIVDESMLTGESVPQMKESVEKLKGDEVFDLNNHGKLNCLFSGTKVVNHTPPPKASMGLKAPDNGCVGYVLRTGFSTSQGKLLKTILYGVKRVTANNLEAFLFILFLLVFAIMAASYVWVEGTKDPKRNKYKLFLECTLILTSVVPPELPIELSLAVNSSLFALSKLGVYCTEPFRIPFAGKVDVCCFDKTGTLTSDDLVLEGVAGLDETAEIMAVDDVPQETKRILASCHALTYVDENLVGDPMEKAFLNAVEWNFTKGDACIPKKGQKQTLKILHRYHFSSMLKRMSVIASLQTSDSSAASCFVMAKGAPEVIKEMLVEVPSKYCEIHKKLSREGGRVLALGYRNLGDVALKELRDYSREEVEKELIFAGFVVLSCPLKQDSLKVIKEIKESQHHVVMITGDNALTACHVSKALRITTRPVLILSCSDINHGSEKSTWCWQSVDGEIKEAIIPHNWKSFLKKYDLCLTGEGLSVLMTDIGFKTMLNTILINVKVYARVDPKQKEFVTNKLKSRGFIVLMCGDGTNDVGALKHSHVGVALLPGSPEKWQDPQKKEKIKRELADAEDAKKSKGTAPSRATSKAARMRAVTRGDTDSPALKAANDPQKKLRELLKELEEIDQASVVKLGDASIASPFTSKFASITCILHVIRQGRCTLVTTLQMFKILALNALILAYSQSVLYLKGVKFSDGQATLQGILLAGCFLFISRSKPLDILAKRRPLPNIFNLYTILTVLGQFAVHFCAMLYIVQEAFALTPPKEEFVDLEKKFEPNLLNSAVYIIAMSLQMATFAVNYRGRPFMESLHENRPLLLSLLGSCIALVTLVVNGIPEFTQQFEIVEFPPEFRAMLLQILAADIFLAFIVDRFLRILFGNSKLRT